MEFTDMLIVKISASMKKILVLSIVIGSFAFLWRCESSTQVRQLQIAVSKAVPESDYENYFRWLRTADSTIIFYDMYHLELDSALKLLEECDGLLLTGGTDIYPGRFGKEKDTLRILEPNFKRDTLEFALLSKAIILSMPVQGVCRGLQLINVHFGGSLIIDIPTDLDTIIKHQLPDTYECLHEVKIPEKSILNEISGIRQGVTNSNHHQGIDVLGSGLVGMALTNDGLIEAIGLSDRENSSYLLAVQWHPERMDYTNPLSGPIAKRFVSEVKSYARNKQNEKK
jgi:putative glutamine amidotransferase